MFGQSEIDAIEWAQQAEELGVGEIICTSIDRDGMKNGYDNELMTALKKAVNILVIASEGAGNLTHVEEVFLKADVDAVLIASLLHYKECTISEIKNHLLKSGIRI